ncbi:hypothetical protein [Phorcysia thermohydrogeniphila]|uniref:Uncharacterized protein n=1 Tax=Phorcysia thermohydrogeniphila TaxID=936138 RepID=A0A4R1GPH0_9BACT|nr:hypothetical protein [Phorcysia thermohydrogeniphila]TCK06362.1 hypothetical protein CLV27_0163 [Phorcysia thermohydrogeniphila]
MLPLAIAGLLAVGGAGILLGKKLEEDKEKELAFKNQKECFDLAKQGKIDPKVCASIGKEKSFLKDVAEVTEEIGKAIIGASVAYLVTKLVKR